MVIALAPRTFVITVCCSFTDGGRAVFKTISLALAPAAHSRVEHLHFRRCGAPFSNVVLALTPRTL
eukprot:8572232-Pyramimonas_sp.AAC.1